MNSPVITPIFLLAAICTTAVAGDSPFAKSDTPRRNAARGVITRSDGSVYGGQIYTTRAKKIEIYVPKQKHWLKLRIKDIRTLQVSLASEEIVKEWKFREGGFNDKVYTGRVKLDRKYTVTVTYTEDGDEQTVTGHVKGAPIYVEHWDGQRYRFFLKQHHSGEWTMPEQVDTNLVYTVTVDLTRDPEEARKALEKETKKTQTPEAKPPEKAKPEPPPEKDHPEK